MKKRKTFSPVLTPFKKRRLESKIQGVLKVKASSIKMAGKGVFACEDLPRGFQVPYIGKVYEPGIEFYDYTYTLLAEDGRSIDGNPIYNRSPFNVAFRVNDPPKGKKPNCRFEVSKGWTTIFSPMSIQTTRKICAGEELFVDYGPDYERSWNKKK